MSNPIHGFRPPPSPSLERSQGWESKDRKKGPTLMRSFALSPKFSTMAVVGAALLAFSALQAFAQPDPPDEAGRISVVYGTASIQTAGSDDWGQAYPNLPLGPGDRIFTDQNSQVEIQVGQSYVRVGPYSDITLVGADPGQISFGVAQGSVHVHSYGFWQGQSLDVSTPNGDAQLSQPGELRADVYTDEGTTIFTSFGNGIFISGAGGFGQQLAGYQSLQLAGTNPVYPQWLQPNGADPLDQWSQQRDQQIANAMSYRYVSPEMPGAAELDANGDWVPDSDYGPIWFPRNLAADWEPYHYGHWINRDPWGWVWVEDESWGYTPFHYGRWVSYRGRWGWVPGPREGHPVWSPALVVFAGGGGVGVSAWFPLGPGEPYRPWYPCSPRYIDRVNISNIRESRIVHVQTTYVNIVNVRNVTNITYVNRSIGVSAMRQDDFAAGRPVRQAAVNVNRAQFDHVQVVDRPAPVTMQSIVTRPVAHPVQVSVAHPTFINQKGMQITAKPGAPPQAPPVRQVQAVRTPPGRTVVAPPAGARYQNAGPSGPVPNNDQGRPAYQDRGGSMPNQQPANNNTQQPTNGNGQQRIPIQPSNGNQGQGVRPAGGPIPGPARQLGGNPGQQPDRNNGQGQPNNQPRQPAPPPNQPPAERQPEARPAPPQPQQPSRPPENNQPQYRPAPQQPPPPTREPGNQNVKPENRPPADQHEAKPPQPPPNKDNGKNNKDNKKDDKKKPE